MIATPTTISLLDLPEGAFVTLPMTWAAFEDLLHQRGDRSLPRLSYCDGYSQIKMPGFEHAKADQVITHLVEQLLIATDRDYTPASPVTLKLPQQAGIEPDHCFWINNWQVVNDLTKIDLSIDPPPDITIEVDITSRINIASYLPFQIPEVWLITSSELQIYALVQNQYIMSATSQFFTVNVAQLFTAVLAGLQSGKSLFRAVQETIKHQ